MGIFDNQPQQPEQPASNPRNERIEMLQKGMWTSDLSVDELALTHQAGFDPVGLVMGSSIYHIGLQNQGGWKKNFELATLSQAMYNVRELALTRMQEEAEALGADGIIGVRLEFGRYEWGPDLIEFVAIGTAVKSQSGQSAKNALGKAFTSTLSGQDFYKLRAAGYMPVGVTMGSCVYHIAAQGMMQSLRNFGQNVEMENYTQGLYFARELAMERMQKEGEALQAHGITAVDVNERSHGWSSHIIEFYALGTAVVRAPALPVPPMTMTLPMSK